MKTGTLAGLLQKNSRFLTKALTKEILQS